MASLTQTSPDLSSHRETLVLRGREAWLEKLAVKEPR